jgi:catechol 2,3-dioxygenase-like lactoylglutathione lyase family enzyme
MKLAMRRVILFVKDVEGMAEFYEGKLGLKLIGREKGFVDLDAGAVRLALHSAGAAKPGRTKICFYVDDVPAVRTALVKRGVRMGKDSGGGAGLKLCDGKDPEGNAFQLSNRK